MKKFTVFILLSIVALLGGCDFTTDQKVSGPAELCNKTGGRIVNCAKAVFVGCANSFTAEGAEYACTCKEGMVWDAARGCR